MHVLIVGAGNMAIQYAKVLTHLNIGFEVIGRSKENAANIKTMFHCNVYEGGLEQAYEHLENSPTHAIVATNFDQLANNSAFLIKKGIKKILVEKPGFFEEDEIEHFAELSKGHQCEVFVAYNRRFYESVITLERLIKEEGGITSFFFEFTEWGHILTKLNKKESELEKTLLGNSSHVIDLAFFLGGSPKELHSFITGGMSWHPSGSVFTGAGVTEKGIPFSYHSNWESSGSWRVEVFTKRNKFILRPLEKLKTQAVGSLTPLEVQIDDEWDTMFKPGLYRQMRAFLFEENKERLLTISEQKNAAKTYKKINGGQL